MSESTAIEQPATVSEDLAAAFAEHEVDPAPPIDAPEPPADDPESLEVDPVPAPEDDPAPAPTILEAPSNWSQEHRDVFAALAELEDKGLAAQQFLIDRHKEMEGEATRKFQEAADLRKETESLSALAPVAELLAPFQQVLAQSGQTPESLIQHYISVDQQLSNNPAQAIAQLASQYGVDLATLQATENVQTDPNVARLEQQLNGLQQQIQQTQEAEAQQRQTEILNEIDAFSQQKTEAGELAHPHFEEVYEDMTLLAQVQKSQGKNPSLSDLYETACRMNTAVNEKIQAAQREAAEKDRLEAARQKAAKAKQASKTVDGTPSGASPSESLSLRDQLAQQFAAS